MSRLYLVACVSEKADRPLPARELYRSAWFRKARAFVEARGGAWRILSALHGLVSPEQVLAPYEQTLNGASAGERRAWAERVAHQLAPALDGITEVVLLAGQRYREHLVPFLAGRGIAVDVPMRGLSIGRQLAWLTAHAAENPRLTDLRRFYELLGALEERQGGKRTLAEGSGDLPRDASGVYFFFDAHEPRSDSGSGYRVVRVGTHGVSTGSKSTLWQRLRQHRGSSRSGGGNHRGSVFRLLVGKALLALDPETFPHWGVRSSAPRSVRDAEHPLEVRVSGYIRQLPYLWIRVEDPAGPDSLRAYLERNAIALLSNWSKAPLDPATPDWLGHRSHKDRVRESGLWNSNHVEERHESNFLEALVDAVRRTPGPERRRP